ncbi:MAG: PASTA domain-containing protein [candidate division WOR-3 bacterium]
MKKSNQPLTVFLWLLIFITIFVLIILFNNLLMPFITRKGQEVVLPKLTGMTQKEAESTLHRLGLKIGEVRLVPNSEIPPERVVTQYPRFGRRVKRGREIDLDISLGSPKIKIPDLIGLPLSNALATLEQSGFVVTQIESVRTPRIPAGRVASLWPPPGTEVRKGCEIKISVSTKVGTFPMPNLVGLNIETARGVIISYGLNLGQVKLGASSEPAGTVLFQYPEEGMTVGPGDSVSLIVAQKSDSVH